MYPSQGQQYPSNTYGSSPGVGGQFPQYQQGYSGTTTSNPAAMGMGYTPYASAQTASLGQNAALLNPMVAYQTNVQTAAAQQMAMQQQMQQQQEQAARQQQMQMEQHQMLQTQIQQQYQPTSSPYYTTPAAQAQAMGQSPVPAHLSQALPQQGNSPTKSFYSPVPNPQWGQAQMMVQPTNYAPATQVELGNSGIYYSQPNPMTAIMNNFTTTPLPVYGNGFMNNAPKVPEPQPKKPIKPNRFLVCCNDGYGGDGMFSHSLFQCCEDPKLCISICFCPCLIISRSWKQLTDQSAILACILFGCVCIPCRFRTLIRQRYGIEGKKWEDWAVMCSPCCCCALTQAEREFRDKEKPTTGGPEKQSMV